MLRIVLDTDVIVAAMRSPTGASAAILRIADAGGVQLLVSVALALEYEAQCTSLEHFQAAGIAWADAKNFANAVITLAKPVQQRFFWRPQLRDSNDEMVLETAINGQADILITFNLRDFGQAPSRFGISALRPAEAIWRIRS